MTNDVENPKVKQLLERIESETMTAKQLMTLYNNTRKYKGISDLERELIIAAIEKDLKLNCPKEASKKFGSKDADGRVLLETVYEKIKSEFDLSGNHVGNGIKVGGDMMAGAQSQTSMEDTDESDVVYVRASMLWAATEDTDALVSVFHQENSADSDTYMRLTDGQNSGEEWENGRRFLTPGDFEADVISLEVESDLGFATFSSSTSSTETTISASNDISNLYESNYSYCWINWIR